MKDMLHLDEGVALDRDIEIRFSPFMSLVLPGMFLLLNSSISSAASVLIDAIIDAGAVGSTDAVLSKAVGTGLENG
jgi:hypothetical protein